MTGPFVTQLRTRGDVLRLTGTGGPVITVRVEMPEVWDTVRAIVSSTEPVVVLKQAALDALYPHGEPHEAFVIKLGGFEVLDEGASVAAIGAVDGSILLLTHRNRRPVR
jgi:hypothetical protein